jgi:hypothetical protein
MGTHVVAPEAGLAVDLPAPWRPLDRPGPDVRGTATSVLVGPPGVVLVLAARAPRGRHLDRLLAALVHAGDELAPLAGVRRDEVHAVLCVTDDQHVDTWRHGVAITSPTGLSDTLEVRRALLSDAEVDEVAGVLSRALVVGGRHRKAARR